MVVGRRDALVDGNQNRCQSLGVEIGFWFEKVVDCAYFHTERRIENENKQSIGQRKSPKRSLLRPTEIESNYYVIYMGLVALPIVIRDLNIRTIEVRFVDRSGYCGFPYSEVPQLGSCTVIKGRYWINALQNICLLIDRLCATRSKHPFFVKIEGGVVFGE
jgi:hypothetical protein